HRDRALAAAAGLAAHAHHDLLGERNPDLLVVDELGMLLHLLDRAEPRLLVAGRVERERVALTETPVALGAELGPGTEEREVDVEQHGPEHTLEDTGGARPCGSGPCTSGCPDLNWGPLRPERSALPGCATPRTAGKGSWSRVVGSASWPSGTTSSRSR